MFVVVFKKKEDKPERPPRRSDSLRSTRHPNWTRQYRNVNNGLYDVDGTPRRQSITENNQKMEAVFGTSAAATRGRPNQRKHKKKSLKKVKRFLLFGDCTDPKHQDYHYNDPADHQYIDDEEDTHPPENTATIKKTSSEYQMANPTRQPRPVKQSQAKPTEVLSNIKASSTSLGNANTYKQPRVAISASNIRKPQGSLPSPHKQSSYTDSKSYIRKPQSSSPTLETAFPYESRTSSRTEFFQNPFKTEFSGSEISGSDDGYHTTNITKHTSEAMFTETFRSEKVISRGPDSQEPSVMTAIEKFHSMKNSIHSPETTSSEQRSSGYRNAFSSSMENFRKGKAASGPRGDKAGVTKATEYLPKPSSEGER